MYCNNCGVKLKDKKTCSNCGETISDELINYDSKSWISGLMIIILIILGVGSLIGFGIYAKNTNLGVLILALCIGGCIYLASRKNFSGEMRPCPECDVDRPATDFCIECGHNLKAILGYFVTLGWNRLELSQNGLTAYQKKHKRIGENYAAVGVKKFYELNQIKNLQIADCVKSSKDKGYPCIDFDYSNEHINYHIPKKKINELDEILSTDTLQPYLKESYNGYYKDGSFNKKK